MSFVQIGHKIFAKVMAKHVQRITPVAVKKLCTNCAGTPYNESINDDVGRSLCCTSPIGLINAKITVDFRNDNDMVALNFMYQALETLGFASPLILRIKLNMSQTPLNV